MTGSEAVPTPDDARRATEVLLQAGAETVLLYGSVARGDATEHSDIDLIAIYDNIDYDQRRKMASRLAPSSQRRSSTERPRRPTWTVTHRAARDVNNVRWGPIVGSCSMNDLIAHSGFGHVHRRFRHRSRTGRGRALRDPITTSSGALLVRPVVVRAASHPHLSFPGVGLPSASTCPLRRTRGGVLSPPHG